MGKKKIVKQAESAKSSKMPKVVKKASYLGFSTL